MNFLALEIMGPGYRTFAGMMICLFFAVALMILAGLAYVFNSWFSLALVTSVPFVSLFRSVLELSKDTIFSM